MLTGELFAQQIPAPPPKEEEVRAYPSATRALAPEFRSETFPLGFVNLYVYYVDLIDADMGRGYWTWRMGTHLGEQFRTKNEAKWDAAAKAFPMVKDAAETLKTIYDKAVNRQRPQ